ncbi:MAG: hypothetical protein IK144_13230 [Bacteroidaceae bacterium]|nr:hypothetical protein [Bacteroidaceae bacterium]
MKIMDIDPKSLSGRNRRLLHEWQKLEQALDGRSDICCNVDATNADGLPIRYHIDYYINSLCGVTRVEALNQQGVTNEPLFANHYQMLISLPANYPCVDGAPVFCFLTTDNQGQEIPHPWHPNIRYFGAFAGRVCINMSDTYTDLLWGVKRVASYLRYDCYHAVSEPPYPEDLQVAAWVIRQGEPNGWIPLKS